jgi:hypothetical protein
LDGFFAKKKKEGTNGKSIYLQLIDFISFSLIATDFVLVSEDLIFNAGYW